MGQEAFAKGWMGMQTHGTQVQPHRCTSWEASNGSRTKYQLDQASWLPIFGLFSLAKKG